MLTLVATSFVLAAAAYTFRPFCPRCGTYMVGQACPRCRK